MALFKQKYEDRPKWHSKKQKREMVSEKEHVPGLEVGRARADQRLGVSLGR